MADSNFDSLVVAGVPTVGMGQMIAGNVYWVNSATGSDTNDGVYGRSKDKPFDTIDYAIGIASADGQASKGAVIYVLPGHAETGTAAAFIDIDVAGISLVGLGNGNNKPTITLGTATTTDIDIDADNVLLKNFRFVGDIDSLAAFIDCNSNYFTIEDCEFVTSSTKEAVCFIDMATTKDYLTVRRCRFEQPTDPAGSDQGAGTGGIYLVDSEYVLVQDCLFVGNFETACIHNKTTACKYLVVERCYMYQALSSGVPIELVTASIGVVKESFLHTPAEVAATEGTLFGTFGDAFFIAASTSAGNDGAAGGQGGIVATAAS